MAFKIELCPNVKSSTGTKVDQIWIPHNSIQSTANNQLSNVHIKHWLFRLGGVALFGNWYKDQ